MKLRQFSNMKETISSESEIGLVVVFKGMGGCWRGGSGGGRVVVVIEWWWDVGDGVVMGW
jgi:hypothetical protein